MILRTAVGVFGAAAAVVAGAALAGTTAQKVAFTGSYAGTATSKVTGSKVDLAAKGTGTGTLIGNSKLAGTGTGDASNPPCVPFNGPGTITGKTGSFKFTVKSTSKGCVANDQKTVSVSGSVSIAGGTGKFVKAKGTLKFTGTYNRGSGAFSVKFTGTLTV